MIGDGCAVRDYIHVDDVASAVTCLLNYEGAERVFNVGSGQGHSINDIIALLKNCMTVPEPRHVPARGFDVASNVLDTSRLTTETSWRCAIPLGEGIVRVYHSMREAMKQ